MSALLPLVRLPLFRLLSSRCLFSLLTVLIALTTLPVSATELPTGVLRFVRSLDKNVKVRADGLIVLSDGSMYLPVLPQDPTVEREPRQVARQWLGKTNRPELIQFNNNLFLVHLNKGGRGKLLFPKMPYPIELKEGLLPQDMQLPPNLVVPGELKVILGSIAYNAKHAGPQTQAEPDWIDVAAPQTTPYQPGTASNGEPVKVYAGEAIPANQLYLADVNTQQMLALNLVNGQMVSKTDLGCMPSALTPTPGGLLALATCLNTNTLIVVDPITQQVRSQFQTGKRPSAVMVMNESSIWVANRFETFLSVFPLVPVLKETGEKSDEENTLTLDTEAINLPTTADMLIQGPKPEQLLAVESASGTVHLVDSQRKSVIKSMTTQPALSGATIQHVAGDAVIWTISRTGNTAKAFSLKTGKEMASITTGQKPVALALGAPDRLYVLCAGDHRVDVLDPLAGSVLTTVPLPADSFPTNLAWNGKNLYASSAELKQVFVINPQTYQVQNTWTGRGSVLAFNVPTSPVINSEPVAALATTAASGANNTESTESDKKTHPRRAADKKQDKSAGEAAKKPRSSWLGSLFRL